MAILVTGAAGFIGSALSSRLVSLGHRVVGIDDLSSGKESNVISDVEFFNLGVEHVSVGFLEKYQIVSIAHLAGQSGASGSESNPRDDLDRNIAGTLALVRAAAECQIRNLVFASSVAVYGDGDERDAFREDDILRPMSPYGVSKIAAEHYCGLYQARTPLSTFVSLRLFNTYGPGQDTETFEQGIFSIFLGQAVARGVISVRGTAERLRDMVFIDDCVEAFVRALTFGSPGFHTFNVSTGAATSVGEIVSSIIGALPLTRVIWGEGSNYDPRVTIGDPSRIREILGWEPTVSFQSGASKTLSSVLD